MQRKESGKRLSDEGINIRIKELVIEKRLGAFGTIQGINGIAFYLCVKSCIDF